MKQTQRQGLTVEDGTDVSPRAMQKPTRPSFTAPGTITASRPQRVSSSTTPSRIGDSEAHSVEDAGAWFASQSDKQFHGQDRHVLQMIDGMDDAEADTVISNYF